MGAYPGHNGNQEPISYCSIRMVIAMHVDYIMVRVTFSQSGGIRVNGALYSSYIVRKVYYWAEAKI